MTSPFAPGSAPHGGPEADRLPLFALLAAFLVGPLGVILGVWALSRGGRGVGTGRGLATAAVVVGLVQTVVVAAFVVPGLSRTPPSPAAPTNTPFTYPTTPPPSGPVVDPTVTPTPAPPSASTLEEFVPEKVDELEWGGGTTDQDTLDQGASQAETGTFTGDDENVEAAMAEWPTVEEAAAAAERAGSDAFDPAELRSEGPIRGGAGYFWYYEKDGRGTVFWYHGKFSAEFSGEPEDVQFFFLRFPK